MSGGDEPRVRGLRPSDPRELGAYRIVGRLGEGGMGSVYLADSPDGRAVALKVIRGELAHNPEFRRRFRSEVARARQVPPFCTAEVLDADTDHDPPYLVVEYVDGPSLAAVVEERGPLTPANQHGLAVGVAVALTAIHGAGVIHRDLKPGNVLLAPGSPKVIDFGIARGDTGTDAVTKTDQMVGTVAYMAPERFGPNASSAITPAADIFAWGAIVAYAATGRTPFGADLPAAMAVRILTQPPDLQGLSGPLRDLVERALAKDPAARPTARELVDHLLAGGARETTRPAAFAEQPEVLAAAGITPTRVGAPSPVGVASVPPQPTRVGTELVDMPPPRRGVGGRVLLTVLTLVVLLLAGAVAAILTGKIPLQTGTAASPAPSSSSSSSPPSTAARPSVAPGAARKVNESLAAPGAWLNRDDTTFNAVCNLNGRLIATLATEATYRCPGRTDTWTDFSAFVTVTLVNPGSCAGIWFRYTNTAGGYALRVCEDGYHLVTHTPSAQVGSLRSFPQQTALNTPVKVGIMAEGSTFRFFRDGTFVDELTDSTYARGRVVLGVFQVAKGVKPPFAVEFRDIEIYAPPGL